MQKRFSRRNGPKGAGAETAPGPLATTLGSFRTVFGVIFVFSLFVNLLALVSPFYMLQVYDRVLASGSKDTLYVLTLLAVGLLAVYAFLDLVRNRIMGRLGNRLNAEVGPVVFDAAFRRRIVRAEAGGGQSLRDIDTIRQFMTGQGFLAFFDAPWTPFYLLLIFLMHPALGVVALGGGVVLFGLALASELATRGPVRDASAETNRAHRFVEQALRNAEAVEAMGMQPRVRERWLERSLGGLAHSSAGGDRSAALSAIAKFVRPLLQIGVLGVGAWLAIERVISPGVMIAASVVMGRALAPIETSIAHWRSFVGAREAHRRLDALLGEHGPTAERMSLPAPTGRVAVDGVTAAAPAGGPPILVGVSFEVQAGEIVAVVGRSASGKSTLARLLVGVWHPTVGHVRLDGADLSDWNGAELGRHVGYLPQDVELFEGTVAENIARFEAADTDAIIRAAKLAGAHEAILALPSAYDTVVGDGGATLSGGQRQRVALARALYGEARLIVLDEPDAHLDDEGRAALAAALERMRAEGRTVFVVSHRGQALGRMDRVLVVDRGRVAAVTPKRQEPDAGRRIVDLSEVQGRLSPG